MRSVQLAVDLYRGIEKLSRGLVSSVELSRAREEGSGRESSRLSTRSAMLEALTTMTVAIERVIETYKLQMWCWKK